MKKIIFISFFLLGLCSMSPVLANPLLVKLDCKEAEISKTEYSSDVFIVTSLCPKAIPNWISGNKTFKQIITEERRYRKGIKALCSMDSDALKVFNNLKKATPEDCMKASELLSEDQHEDNFVRIAIIEVAVNGYNMTSNPKWLEVISSVLNRNHIAMKRHGIMPLSVKAISEMPMKVLEVVAPKITVVGRGVGFLYEHSTVTTKFMCKYIAENQKVLRADFEHRCPHIKTIPHVPGWLKLAPRQASTEEPSSSEKS